METHISTTIDSSVWREFGGRVFLNSLLAILAAEFLIWVTGKVASKIRVVKVDSLEAGKEESLERYFAGGDQKRIYNNSIKKFLE